jgi:hypothetical protein
MPEIGPPQVKPVLPWQFKWKAMIAGNLFWLYEVTCKYCKTAKLSDYQNVQEWMHIHVGENCRKIWK